MTDEHEGQTFATGMVPYFRAGWAGVIPVPPEAKWPPPAGFTGAAGADPTPEQLIMWATTGYGNHSVALRMPEGVIGVDVDDYTKSDTVKAGGATLATKIEQWGPLPATWVSTARGDDRGPGTSGIRFFRVPAGRYATVLGADVEVIQRHHRYAVVSPSTHPGAGARYRWYRPDGTPAAEGEVPTPADLPELPLAWVDGLRANATAAGPPAADPSSGDLLLSALLLDEREACADMADAVEQSELKLAEADIGARHDAMTARARRVVALGAYGHPGAGSALARLREKWHDLTGGEDREAEFDSMLLTAARKSVTEVGTTPVVSDPCLMTDGWLVPAPTPVVDPNDFDEGGGPSLPGPLTEPVHYSWRHIIGTAPFDPESGEFDQTLAGEVLRRVWPMMRHASDTKSGWLQRGPTQWELHGDLTRRAVSEVAGLMPKGDPTPIVKGEAPTREQRQFARRKRFLTNATANAVSTAMKALVLGGFHPSAVRLADLDSEPEVLWAGGMPYDLRASVDGPAFAHVELNTPHLVSAGVSPDLRETPRWDALLAEVWPDPEVRAWALRVLSISLTGHPDAALPILLGHGGSGKTSTIELIMSVLGSYAHAANVKLLSGEASHDSIVFALKGRRLSFIDEGPREGRWAQERLKQLTGGAMLTGNAMNQNPITFRPTHTLVLTANTEPVLTDEAVRRRVRLIPCEGDPAAVRAARAALTPAVWAREAPGVLAMLMRETGRWLADPDSALTSAAPASIRDRAEKIAAEQDVVGRWLAEACEEWEPGTPSGELHEAFVGWCRNNAIKRHPDMKEWAAALDKRGYTGRRSSRGVSRKLRVRSREPWLPGGAPDLSGSAGWTPPGAGSMQSETGAPYTPDKRRSDPLFSSSVQGVQGEPPMRELGDKEDSSIWPNATSLSESGGVFARGYTDSCESGPLPAKTGVQAPCTPPVHPAHPVGPPPSSRNVSKRETARKADEDKISKAEARRALAEEKRRATVAEVGGEVHPLPATVDRAGNVVPTTLAQAATTVMHAIDRSGALTVDVETSGYPVGHRDFRLRSVQLGDATAAVVLDPRPESEGGHADAIRALLAAAPRLHAHSATADLVPLAHAGLIDVESGWDRMYDTVLPAKLVDPAITGSDPGLKQLAGTVLGHDATAPAADEPRAALFKAGKWLTNPKTDTEVERNGWAQVPTGCETMLRYAASDVLDTAALAQVFSSVEQQAPQVLARERHAQRMTARITDRGVRLEPATVAALREQHLAGQAEAAALVRAFGVDNPGSGQQVAAKALELGAELPSTPTGKPSVPKDVLERLAKAEGQLGAFMGGVLTYRHHETALGLFLAPYTELVERGDGRARPTIYTLGTDTGRMSATRPNIQQLPREGGVRACITADPGEVLISADFSGVELRVAAALSGDQGLRQIIDDEAAGRGDGLHWIIARQIWGPEATKAHRYVAKRIVFGRIYGGGLATLAAQVGVTPEVGQQVIDTLDAITPTLAAWSRGLSDAVRRGQTTFPTYSGRVIHLPREYPHKAPNFAIQGSARELLVDALIRWADTKWGRATLFPVHDELVIAVPAEDGEVATAALGHAMAGDVYGVPIVADPSAPSFAWADST